MTKIARLLYIQYVLASHGVDEIVFLIPVLSPLRFLSFLNPWNWRRKQGTRGERLRKSFEQLGPIFVKFGQMLSTRVDLLPADIAQELALLQDKVPPFSGKKVKKILEKTYKRPLDKIFKNFDLKPLASASVAQVHAATLWNDRDVVVKILRPGVEKTITRDVGLLCTLAILVEKISPRMRQFKPTEMVKEFEKSLQNELDLRKEAANASQLRRNFLRSNLLYIPEVHWEFTEPNVLVLERIYGTPISHVEKFKTEHVNFKALAEKGVEIFFTQVFQHNFFHADMHPGNIFINHDDPENPKYLVVDFGIVGSLSARDQRYLAENMLAFFRRDYRRVAELHIESGWVPPDVNLIEFESAIRTVCEPAFEKPLKDISFATILLQLMQAAQCFHIEIQPQLILLQKTLLNIEGLGRQLYPDLDLWITAKPFLERWVRKQLSFQGVIQKIQKNLPYWLEKLPDIPQLLYDNLNAGARREFIRIKEEDKKQTRWVGVWSFLAGGIITVIAILIFNHVHF